jgi:4-amino-4-deoxy-L-arabinose transferase-like glycosyltransferase
VKTSVVLIVFLLLGAALRLSGLGYMHDLLDYDEAYYGLDALTLLEHPRLDPFFPDNNGRESLWMYLLAPSLAVFEARPFALRLVAVFAGILTLVAAYRLSRELLDEQTAVWSTGALAVFYWHVHMSHLAFRALLYPLVGTLAFAFLLQARRTGRTMHWLVCGLLVGLLLYTYVAARLWVVLAIVLQCGGFYRHPHLRRGIALSLLATLLVALPLALYTLNNPEIVLGRVNDQAAPSAIPANIIAWLSAWLAKGSTYSFHNPAGRPILDIPMALLFIAGIVTLLIQRRGVLIFALGLVAVIPSVLSIDAPHFLRAIGLTVPVALVAGVGAIKSGKALSMMLPFLLIVWSGLNTFTTFQTWAREYEIPGGGGLKLVHTQHMVAALEREGNIPLYLYQVSPDDPVFRFMVARFNPRPLELFNFPACTVAPAVPFLALAPLDYEPHTTDPLTQWAQLDLVLADHSADDAEFGYSLYRAAPFNATRDFTFADLVRVGLLNPPPERIRPGDTLALPLRFTPLSALNRPYTVFFHVLNDGLVAQADAPICPDYPSTRWQVGQAVTTTVSLTLPADLTPGAYTLSLGVYDSETLVRLPVDGDDDNAVVLRTVVVE